MSSKKESYRKNLGSKKYRTNYDAIFKKDKKKCQLGNR